MSAFQLPTPPPSSSSEESEDEVVEYTPETPYITELEPFSAVYEPVFLLDESTKFFGIFRIADEHRPNCRGYDRDLPP